MNSLQYLIRQKRILLGISLLALIVYFRSSVTEKETLSLDDMWLKSFTTPIFKPGDRFAERSDIYEGVCRKEVWLLEDAGRFGNKFLEYVGARVVATFQKKEVLVTDKFYLFFQRYFTGLRAAAVNEEYLSAHCNVSENSWKEISQEYFVDKDRLLVPLEHPKRVIVEDFSIVSTIGHPLNITSVTWSVMFRHRDILLKEFKFKTDFMAKVNLRIKQVTKGFNYSALIGIHVRRTDFYNHMIQLYGQAKTAGTDYFERAKAIYRQRYGNPLFMVLSDDVAWCAKNLRAPDVVFPGRGNQDDPGWDLAFLASCDHLILTYGTFGVTAAYFSGGDVVIADNFTGKPNDLNERLKMSNLTNWTWLTV